jgi:hypothetical protein
VTRNDYLAEVVRLYLLAPDTPRKASRRDWAIASDLYQRSVPLQTVAHAIRFATLRRHLRDPDLGPLEPIHSLAYYRRVIDLLEPLALDPGYVDYVAANYRRYFPETAAKPPKYRGF